MKTRYEYIRLLFDFGDLNEMNELACDGWKVVAVVEGGGCSGYSQIALMEREVQ